MDPRAEPYGSLEDDENRGIVILARSAGIQWRSHKRRSRKEWIPELSSASSLEDDGKRGIVILSRRLGIHYGHTLLSRTAEEVNGVRCVATNKLGCIASCQTHYPHVADISIILIRINPVH